MSTLVIEFELQLTLGLEDHATVDAGAVDSKISKSGN